MRFCSAFDAASLFEARGDVQHARAEAGAASYLLKDVFLCVRKTPKEVAWRLLESFGRRTPRVSASTGFTVAPISSTSAPFLALTEEGRDVSTCADLDTCI
eukprot:CAMPEP_0184495354 /NCGR_PEP_ID=MMETSP0113_2-20130426/31057_1 /TAXON_ID=91329 /ORGANISM="Norrisiella sphaerica, Strain BC52" /LENGTH=100 /DNA_ID=CAMNT_0026881511 /DNA_START=640 /DNA_END=942 /DNA_ORIENTATION=-